MTRPASADDVGRVCLNCDMPFFAFNRTYNFCSSECALAAWKRREHEKGQVTVNENQTDE